jgi:hypothetical protein
MDIDQYLLNITTSVQATSSFLISDYLGGTYNLFPQLGIEGAPNKSTKDALQNQTSVELRWLDAHTIKRTIEPWRKISTWYLACLLYNNTPIAILRNCESTEDRFGKLFVINKTEYYYAASYLFTFVKEDFGPNLELYDIVGSFSGDTAPNINGVNIKSYDLTLLKDKEFINNILLCTF